jgi:integrase/recombinase XerD
MLTPTIDAYLAIRRAAGFQLEVAESLLRNYARFADERGETHVSTQTALQWAALAPSLGQRGRRLETVTIFARHAHVEDSQHQVPASGIFSSQRPPYRPFIYTAEQIRQLLEHMARLPPIGSLRPWTYSTLIALLAVSGLRISEALSLRFEEFTSDGLVINETKFHKSRIVPLHPSAHAALERYLERRRSFGSDDDHVFISLRGRALCYPTVVATFLAAVREMGLHQGPGKRGPRLHDLRHTWAVRALEACPPGYEFVSQHLVAVSTYLGHAKLASTFIYLHTTPQLLSSIADRCEFFREGDIS